MRLCTRFNAFIFLALTICAPTTSSAQIDAATGPPKVLVVDREFTRPARGGTMHEKTESAYVRALASAKSPAHYFALTSLTGQSRSLFFTGYASFAAWETDNKSVEGNAMLSAALDRASMADADMLSQFDTSVWTRRDDLSLNMAGLLGDRYIEMTQFIIRPGRLEEWNEMFKLIMQGYKKGVPAWHWTTYQQEFGSNNNAFVVMTPFRALTDVDQERGSGSAFREAMGEAGVKRVEELEAACVESEQTSLYYINPRISYPPEEWVKAEPDFWKPKPPSGKKNSSRSAE